MVNHIQIICHFLWETSNENILQDVLIGWLILEQLYLEAILTRQFHTSYHLQQSYVVCKLNLASIIKKLTLIKEIEWLKAPFINLIENIGGLTKMVYNP